MPPPMVMYTYCQYNVALLDMNCIHVTQVHMHTGLSLNTKPSEVEREKRGGRVGEDS